MTHTEFCDSLIKNYEKSKLLIYRIEDYLTEDRVYILCNYLIQFRKNIKAMSYAFRAEKPIRAKG